VTALDICEVGLAASNHARHLALSEAEPLPKFLNPPTERVRIIHSRSEEKIELLLSCGFRCPAIVV
jgi:hypothetical protein